MISQEAIQAILGIQEKVNITPEEMADKVNIIIFGKLNILGLGQ